MKLRRFVRRNTDDFEEIDDDIDYFEEISAGVGDKCPKDSP